MGSMVKLAELNMIVQACILHVYQANTVIYMYIVLWYNIHSWKWYNVVVMHILCPDLDFSIIGCLGSITL